MEERGFPHTFGPDPPVQQNGQAGGQELTLMGRMYLLVIDHFLYKLSSSLAEANDLLRSLSSSKSFLSPLSDQ
jgi:hypothetical protein